MVLAGTISGWHSRGRSIGVQYEELGRIDIPASRVMQDERCDIKQAVGACWDPDHEYGSHTKD